MTNRRKVQFVAELDQEFESNSDGTSLSELWYSASEFKAIRTEAQVIAQESRHFGMAQLLDDAVIDINNNPSEVQDNLTLWSRHAHSRRGLEMMISQCHARQRKYNKQLVRRTVLGAQMKLHDTIWSPNEKADLIAALCLRQTAPSMQFAALMGQADVINSNPNEPSCRPGGSHTRPIIILGSSERSIPPSMEVSWTGSPTSITSFGLAGLATL
jgi:hypothetical protein